MPTNWTFSYNGLNLGGSTQYSVRNIDGLAGADIRTERVTKAEHHGQFVYARYYDGRTITVEGDIVDDGVSFENLVSNLKLAFVPQNDELPFAYVLGNGVSKYVNCRPTRLSIPISVDGYDLGIARFVVELVAEDPRAYSGTGPTDTGSGYHTLTLNSGGGNNAANGLDFGGSGEGLNFGGAGQGLDFGGNPSGGAGTGTGTAQNDGNIGAPPTMTITGAACTNPEIHNITYGLGLVFTLTMTASDILVIDTQARTVMLNGVSRYDTLNSTSTWWNVEPGANTVRFATASGNPSCVITWQNAWA